jgi:hypothetical protein
MSQRELEARVAAVEKQLAEIQATLRNGHQVKDWRRTAGMFTGDEVMKRIFENALRYREADRRKVRRRRAKVSRSK